MAGKLCYGRPNRSAGAAVLKQSKAFCEGRTAINEGADLDANPHPSGTLDYQAWNLGYISGGSGAPDAQDCCAYGQGSSPDVAITLAVTAAPDTLTIASGASDVSVVTVTANGSPLPGVQVEAVSNNESVATVDVPDVTDDNGQTTITVNGIATLGGSASIAVDYFTAGDSIAVTVTAAP